MPAVTLTQAWFHDATNHADYLALDVDGESEQTDQAGEVRRYAGGRLRSIARVGVRQALPLRFELVSRSNVDGLRARIGRLQLFRDTRGRKLWGVFYAVEVEEIAGVDRVNVAVTFQQVTYSEVV